MSFAGGREELRSSSEKLVVPPAWVQPCTEGGFNRHPYVGGEKYLSIEPHRIPHFGPLFCLLGLAEYRVVTMNS
jgi:hypothetical protein